MSDLVEFLKARLDEDEQAARAAAIVGEDWAHNAPDAPGVIFTEPDGRELIVVGEELRPVTEHLVNHDPARVLREVEAKRRIVEMEDLETNRWLDDEADRKRALQSNPGRQVPASRYFRSSNVLSDVLRVLALPYADHPDYDPAWRP